MFRAKLTVLLAVLLAALACFGSAYQASPKLVVILVIDQFRGDYLERYHSEFGPNGFRLFTDRGAYFPACYYQYANTRTAPGHATHRDRRLQSGTWHLLQRVVGPGAKARGQQRRRRRD